jgi:hypothetical protein
MEGVSLHGQQMQRAHQHPPQATTLILLRLWATFHSTSISTIGGKIARTEVKSASSAGTPPVTKHTVQKMAPFSKGLDLSWSNAHHLTLTPHLALVMMVLLLHKPWPLRLRRHLLIVVVRVWPLGLSLWPRTLRATIPAMTLSMKASTRARFRLLALILSRPVTLTCTFHTICAHRILLTRMTQCLQHLFLPT